MTSPYLAEDDIVSRMVRALKWTNLRSDKSVRKVLIAAGFSEEEIASYGKRAVETETLRRSVMLTKAIKEDDDNA